MYVIGVNENLIETLRLIVQDEPLFAASSNNFLINNNNNSIKDTIIAEALLIDQIDKCKITEQIWILIIAKEWEQNILNTISNISRILMSQTKYDLINEKQQQENNGRLLIIKKDKSPGDDELIYEHISNVKNEWINEWKKNIEKYRKLSESCIHTEMLVKFEQWILPNEFYYLLTYIDESDILQKIKQFIGINIEKKILINDAPINIENSCFTKPPALHWTNYPRSAEVQVSLNFNFPIGTITEPLFRQFLKLIKESYNWEYLYEWTNGLFLRQQLVKIAIIRTLLNVIEITGRIDKDEASEEDKFDNLNTNKNKIFKPLERVWPYFAKTFYTIFNVIESKKMLPYTLNIAFIGQIFFICPKNGEQITSRSFDLIQTLNAIQKFKMVRFKIKNDPDSIYSLCLEQAFPNFSPIQLSDFQPKNVGKLLKIFEKNTKPLFIIDNNDSSDNESNNLILKKNDCNVQKNCKTIISSSCSSLNNNKNIVNLNNSKIEDRSVIKKQNRRVSFGSIHAIPTNENKSNESTSKHPVSQLTNKSFSSNRLLQTKTTNSFDNDLNKANLYDKNKNNFNYKKNKINKDEIVQTNTFVNNYIDQMLSDTIDDILIEK